MIPLMRLLFVVAFAVVGGYLAYWAGCHIDGLIHPDCELIRFAAVALVSTVVLGFGVLGVLWPVSEP
ncbi:MAG: hypothetical protein L0Z62_04525 [Gemmataceae bacterium]|nr:hypothetical protein [Gemmataceae bacterium]